MAGLNKNSRSASDPRTKVTYAIWGSATGMFALSIPLALYTKGAAIIPATAVAFGAGVGTVAVWQSSDHRSKNSLDAESHVRSRLGTSCQFRSDHE
ncbi:MAG: hypothetical protein C6Y22_30385 [Hapalosiphonaceae cyanobacterium JJU2]|nr:MAG: hypothetical protein C6Y22_30385 [Hapalosiphonaceae cyanobacterium JJU2]